MRKICTRFRGTVAYYQVLMELLRAAQYRGVTTYQEIAWIMGLQSNNGFMNAATGHILGEISEDEVHAGRPLLAAVAVGVGGRPSPAFYGLARDLGRLGYDEDEAQFWRDELASVYEAWRRPSPDC
jgi:hypothetical protein